MTSSQFGGANVEFLQNQIENGRVFESSSIITGVANGGGIAEWVIQTNGRPILLQSASLRTNGNEMTLTPFFGTTFTGGTILLSVNRNGLSTNTAKAKLIESPTVTDEGLPFPPIYLPGSETVGQNAMGTLSDDEVIRILPPNTNALVRMTNNGVTASATIAFFLTWIELVG